MKDLFQSPLLTEGFILIFLWLEGFISITASDFEIHFNLSSDLKDLLSTLFRSVLFPLIKFATIHQDSGGSLGLAVVSIEAKMQVSMWKAVFTADGDAFTQFGQFLDRDRTIEMCLVTADFSCRLQLKFSILLRSFIFGRGGGWHGFIFMCLNTMIRIELIKIIRPNEILICTLWSETQGIELKRYVCRTDDYWNIVTEIILR